MKVDIFLDSGAYSAFTQKKPINIDAYIQYIKDHPEITTYCCLDEIDEERHDGSKVWREGEPTYRNYIYMKEKGLNPLPVYHAGVDYSYLEKYLKMTDYIALGAVAGQEVGKRLHFMHNLWKTKLTDSRGLPIAKFHGFGITSNDVMVSMPWYSVDSTSWVMFSKYGVVLVPQYNEAKRVYDFKRNPYKVIVSDRSPRTPKENGDRKESGKHFLDYEDGHKKDILKYIEMMGFKYGKSNVDWSGDKPKAEVVEPGISNQGRLRDQLNYLYYLQLELELSKDPWPHRKGLMKLYFAGNFPQMSKKEYEKEMMDISLKYSPEYRRLLSFFYTKESQTVLDLKKEVEGCQGGYVTNPDIYKLEEGE
jgi:hypothetical protein